MSETPAFLGRQTAAETAKFWILPAPLDDTADFLKGQAAAPAAILAASVYVEPYDEEVAATPSETAPFHTYERPLETLVEIQAAAAAALEAGAVPVILGGEPLVSLGGIRALSARAEDFTILHVSARAHLADPGGRAPEVSSAVMRRALDCPNLRKIVQVGVRSISAAESEAIFTEDSKVETFFACDLAKSEDDAWQEDVVQELSTPVYLSVDASALDRSVVPSVGAPEPGGLLWWDLLRLLKKVSSRRRIAAFDLVDLIPIEGDLNGEYAVARLAHKIMAYTVVSGKML
ncbi:MAG: arginase family protein [Planctomycetota bacterium]